MRQKIEWVRSWLPSCELILAAAAGALWYTQGGWVEYVSGWPGPWPLSLLLLLWGLRWVAISRRSPSDRPHRTSSRFIGAPPVFAGTLFLFAATAATSLSIACDPKIAAAKGWLMVGALGIYWALAHQPDMKRITLALTLLELAGAGIAGIFLLTQDWGQTPYADTILAQVAQIALTWLPSILADETLNPNVAGGMLILLLPLSVPLITAAFRGQLRSQRLYKTLVITAFVVTLVGWFFTGSRGAHVTLVATACLWLCLRALSRLGPRLRIAATVTLLAVVVVILGFAVNTIADSTPDPTAATAPSTFQNRLWLWQLGASLVRDAPFTGMGIGMFEMPFALYAVLIHVGIVEHAHNLYLDIAIEQGVLGAVAFAVMAISALWWGLRTRSAQVSRLRALDPRLPQQTLILESVMASLSTILIHGLIDDALYSSRGILLFLVPLGLLTALGRLSNGPSTIDQLRPGIWNQLRPTVQSVGITVALTTAAIGGIVWFSGTADQSRGVPWMQRWQAAWHANLGVVRQARIEIAAYDQVRFSNLSIEDVRRQEDLTPASRQFEIAIAIDPRNVTALRRRTLIALATHDYDQAYALMQTVWGAGHRDPVSRLLYGDALVAMGRSDEAVSIIKGLPFAGARLEGQAWDRYQKHGDLERADDARRAAQLVH